jgi:hypothetical protein
MHQLFKRSAIGEPRPELATGLAMVRGQHRARISDRRTSRFLTGRCIRISRGNQGYVYVVNGNGNLAIANFFETAPRLRRQFEREWKAEWKRESRKKEGRSRAEIEQEAATRMLKRLARRLSPEERAVVGSLGLVSARLKMDEDRDITVSELTVAMIGFDGIPFTPPPQEGAEPGDSL